MKCIAHRDENGRVQYLQEHLINTANICSNSLSHLELHNTGYLIGLFHDMGKFAYNFQQYINDGTGEKGKIIHSFAAPAFIYSSYKDKGDLAEILALVLSNHHGLIDAIKTVDGKWKSELKRRVIENKEDNEESIKNFLSEFNYSLTDVDNLVEKSCNELLNILTKLSKICGTEDELYIYESCLIRLLTSALMNADKIDTNEWYTSCTYRTKQPQFEDWYVKLIDKLNSLNNDSEINKCRRQISDLCDKFADNEPCIYKLDLMTGAGKTLCALRYGLKHCKKFNKNRIIYLAPFCSILDQNAEVIKNVISDDNAILVHQHSTTNETVSEMILYKNATDVWDSPIILSTLVQFLNILFSDGSSYVRRFQALQNSVIIIDEVQSIPVRDTALLNLVLNFLSITCKATVLLCSATIPGYDKINQHPMLTSGKEIIPQENLSYYNNVFKRTKINDTIKMSMQELYAFISDQLEKRSNLLCVCNTIKEAVSVFNSIDTNTCHKFLLSSHMCQKHRLDSINKIRQLISDGKKVLCVSTQIIEAGVDISFSCGIRLLAGLDNIVQTAGRVNRNKEYSELCDLYIVDIDNEDDSYLKPLVDIQQQKHDFIAAKHSLNGSNLNSFLSELAEEYYRRRFSNNRLLKYPVVSENNEYKIIDTLYEGLSYNESIRRIMSNLDICIAPLWKTVGKEFKAIDSSNISIIVSYNNSHELSELRRAIGSNSHSNEIYSILQKLKPYYVSISDRDRDLLEPFLEELSVSEDNTIYVLGTNHYDNSVGIVF